MSAFREPLPERKLWEKMLPWVAGLVLAAGVVAVIVKFVPSSNGTQSSGKTEHPTIVSSKPPKTVPLAKEARVTAGRFILTAVRRQNLGAAWKLVGPELRQDLTYKQWLTGNIPVIPYLAPISLTPMKVDYSFRNQALLEVALVPKKGAKVDGAAAKTELYFLELRRTGKASRAHWVVWSWVPRLSAPIRANPSG